MSIKVLMYWKHIAAFAVITGLLAAVYGFGYRTASNHYERVIAEKELFIAIEKADALAQAAVADKALGEQALLQAKLGAEEQRRDTVIANEVRRKVRLYAKNPDSGKCVITPDFLLEHNRAASSGLPEAASAPAG